MWIHHREPKICKNIVWKHTIVHQEKFKSQPSAEKLMLTVFWDLQRLLLQHHQERGSTVNNTRYNEMHTDSLKPTVEDYCRTGQYLSLIHISTAVKMFQTYSIIKNKNQMLTLSEIEFLFIRENVCQQRPRIIVMRRCCIRS